ncbi:BrnT family toxin [Candidatus Curtissbacteria bacterium]|nr:BrnT family toxin [Candidatus Curtissbacteria bacterium]
MSKSSVAKIDINVDTLIVEEDRLGHIAKHGVTLKEILEIISQDYIYIEGKHGRWLLIGKTKMGRFLTVVVGSRPEKNTRGLVTARPSSREERSFYKEFTLQYEYDKIN